MVFCVSGKFDENTLYCLKVLYNNCIELCKIESLTVTTWTSRCNTILCKIHHKFSMEIIAQLILNESFMNKSYISLFFIEGSIWCMASGVRVIFSNYSYCVEIELYPEALSHRIHQERNSFLLILLFRNSSRAVEKNHRRFTNNSHFNYHSYRSGCSFSIFLLWKFSRFYDPHIDIYFENVYRDRCVGSLCDFLHTSITCYRGFPKQNTNLLRTHVWFFSSFSSHALIIATKMICAFPKVRPSKARRLKALRRCNFAKTSDDS